MYNKKLNVLDQESHSHKLNFPQSTYSQNVHVAQTLGSKGANANRAAIVHVHPHTNINAAGERLH